MNILSTSAYYNYNEQFNFKSKNCPVKPFSIQTKNGLLTVEEMKMQDLNKTASFLFDSMKNLITKRIYLKKPSGINQFMYRKYLKNLLIHCFEKEDGNSTILIAKDSKNKIKAITDLQSFDEIDVLAKNGFKDAQTGYIQDCYTATEYRNQGIGKIMLDKILATADGQFSDIFVCSENSSVNFYKKLGFSIIDTSSPIKQKVVNYILNIRCDKDFITPMLKTLTPENNWDLRMMDLIKD